MKNKASTDCPQSNHRCYSNASHVGIRRREAKASDVGGKEVYFDFCQYLYTAIAEIYRFRPDICRLK
jgi:hypothetical protein